MSHFIDTECEACGGTGLYSGFVEPEGVAVVCRNCDGTGRERLTYTPFVARKPKRGVKTVRLSRGTFIATGVGPVGEGISYTAWLAGKKPQA